MKPFILEEAFIKYNSDDNRLELSNITFYFYSINEIHLLYQKAILPVSSWSGSCVKLVLSATLRSRTSQRFQTMSTRLSGHNRYLQSVIIKHYHFTFETKLPKHFLPLEI